MKVLRLADRPDIRLAQLLGAQFGFGAASDLIDQLVDQLGAFRREREEQIAALKEEFDREVEALKAELARTQAEMELLRLLNRWPEQCATRQ